VEEFETARRLDFEVRLHSEYVHANLIEILWEFAVGTCDADFKGTGTRTVREDCPDLENFGQGC